MFLRLILTLIVFMQTLLAVSIELDGSLTRISGYDCSTATYRFGTDSSYQDQDIDLILDVIYEDNDYRGGACVDTQDDVISFHLRDMDWSNNYAFMDLKFTVVKKGTLIPITVDKLTVTNFDLDSNPTKTLTDDVYYKNPTETIITEDSDISLLKGDFYGYDTKLKGKSDGNCNDSSTLTELSCRGAAIWENTSTIYSRVQNDNAYGTSRYLYDHRLIQFSFEYDDIAPLLNPKASISNAEIIEGDNEEKVINFLIKLNNPAPSNDLSIEVKAEDITAEAGLDYIQENFTVTFAEGEDEKIVSYKIKSDLIVEADETFKVTLINPENIEIDEDADSAIATIIDNDKDKPDTPFSCSEESYLTTTITDSTNLYGLNLTSGTSTILADNYTSNSINAIGYNVKDNFIWGWDLTSEKVIKIDANYQIKQYETTIPLLSEGYTSGDVSKDGILYIAKPSNDHKIHKIDLNSGVPIYLGAVSLSNLDVHFGDFAINPIDGQLYSTDDDHLYRVNLLNGEVTDLGKFSGPENYYFHSYVFDRDGNMYFYSDENNGNVFKLDLSNPNSPDLTAEVFSTLSYATKNSDGARCANAELTQPPKIYISNEEVQEGDSGTTTLTFTVALDKEPTINGVSFDYQILNGSAESPSDYINSTPTHVTLSTPTQIYTINVPIVGDNLLEDNETLTIKLTNIQGALIGTDTAVGTIINDDKDISLETIKDLDEDNDGILDTVEYGSCETGVTKLMSFDDFGTGGRVSTPYTTYCYEDGDGVSDCTNYFGNVNVNDGEYAIVQHPSPDASVFTAWSTQGDHTGNTNGRMMVVNASIEPDEFYRRAYNVIPYANMTIDLWILNVINEKTNLIRPNITFKLEDMSGKQIGEVVNTGDIPENGMWNHYTLSINPQENSQVQIVLSNNAPGGSGNDLALDDIRIQQVFCDSDSDGIADYLDLDSDNDGIPDNIEAQSTQNYTKPTYSFDAFGIDTAYPNGLTPIDTDNDGVADYLDLDSDNDGIFDIEESGLGNNDTDNDGRTNSDVGVNGLDNSTTHENNDTNDDVNGIGFENDIFRLKDSDSDTYLDGSNATPMGTDFDYRDNLHDPLTISVNNLEKMEGDSGTTEFVIPVVLSKPAPAGGITIEYTPYGSAVYSDDFSDPLYDNFFTENPNTPITSDVIANITNASITEGDEGTKELKFEVTLSSPAPIGGVTIEVQPHDITAKEEDDYTRVSSSIYIAAGQTLGEVIFLINGDTKEESTEIFEVELFNPINATLGTDSTALGYIEDDDNDNFSFPLPFPSEKVSKITLPTNTVSTKETTPLSLFIPEGEKVGNITILIQGDTAVESNEPFNLALSTPNDVKFLSDTQTIAETTKEIIITIINDDKEPVTNIAEYRFDCFSNNTYKDYSSTANDVTATVASEIRPNSTILCNAIDGYPSSGITIKDNTKYHLNQGSISFWIYDHHTVDNSRKALTKGNFNIGFRAITSTTGKIEISLADGTKILSNRIYDSAIPKWLFITVTFEENGQIKLYMDGSLEGEGAYDNSFNNSSDINVAEYSGFFDEFYLFDGTMSEKEITDLYQQQLNNTNLDGTPRVCGCPYVEPTLVAEYRFDECFWDGSTNSVIDSSGNELHGTSKGDAKTISDGKINRAGYFDGDNDYVEIANDPLLQLTGDASFSLWIKPESLAEGRQGLIFKHYNTEYELILEPTGIISFYHGDGTWEEMQEPAQAKVVEGTWNHIVITRDSTNKLLTWYINGTSVGTDNYIKTPAVGSNSLTIGIRDANKNYGFKGSIDEVKLFDGTLNDETVKEIYDNESSGKNWNGSERSRPTCIVSKVSINDVTQKEDNTPFKFTISLDTPSPMNTAVTYTIKDGTSAIAPTQSATLVDNDYVADTQVVTFLAGETSKTISVNVIADKKMEHNEEFYVDLLNPVLLTIDDSRGVGTIINDDVVSFAIERADSDNFVAPTNDYDFKRKQQLYTQLTNVDFDYSIVSYEPDITDHYEANIEDITLKVDLYDQNDSEDNLLYTKYIYFTEDDLKSRIKILDDYDLKIPKATRKAQFRITTLRDENNSIVYGKYDNEIAFNNIKLTENATEQYSYSDLFSIRPLGYRIAIQESDSAFPDTTYKINDNNTTTIPLFAEYDYKLNINAIIDTEENIATTYNTIQADELNATLKFNDANITFCSNTDDVDLVQNNTINSNFTQGRLQNGLLTHNNVGIYSLEVSDINWTYFDKDYLGDPNLTGCILNSSSNIADNSGRYGCDFSSNIPNNSNYSSLNIEFEAYEFNLSNTVLNNVNNNGKSYIYMGNIDSNQSMGINLFTNILAQGKKHTVLTNFTDLCMAKDVNLTLNYLITTEDTQNSSTYTNIHTTKNTIESFKRVVTYNGIDTMSVERTHLDDIIPLKANKFLTTNEGNSSINILFNINKNLSEPMNPISVNFMNFELNASTSTAKEKNIDKEAEMLLGSGQINTKKLFYFTRVVPDLENYPASYDLNQSTPLSIEIFCDVNRTWCNDMSISTFGLNSTNTIYGWYTVKDHDILKDGTIQLSINPTSDDFGNSNITPTDLVINRGRFDTVRTIYSGTQLDNNTTISVQVDVDITPSSWLKYHSNPIRLGDPFYTTTYKNKNFGTTSGIGDTGYNLNIKTSGTDSYLQSNQSSAKRLDW